MVTDLTISELVGLVLGVSFVASLAAILVGLAIGDLVTSFFNMIKGG